MLYLVRHAKAGNRAKWTGDDRLRPLNAAGDEQAHALGARLAPLADGGQLVSSPYTRCVQTLEPLAALLGTTIEIDDRLAEEAGFSGTLQLLKELPEGSVLCSHGDVIPETMDALDRRGCHVSGEPDWRKASVWVLRRDGDDIVAAEVWPPPV